MPIQRSTAHVFTMHSRVEVHNHKRTKLPTPFRCAYLTSRSGCFSFFGGPFHSLEDVQNISKSAIPVLELLPSFLGHLVLELLDHRPEFFSISSLPPVDHWGSDHDPKIIVLLGDIAPRKTPIQLGAGNNSAISSVSNLKGFTSHVLFLFCQTSDMRCGSGSNSRQIFWKLMMLPRLPPRIFCVASPHL